MSSQNEVPKPFTSIAQLEAVSRPLGPGEELAYHDCACVAPFKGKESDLFISSPNMAFVPTVPPLEHSCLPYYADGMLGPFELLKWPQIYDDLELHACAAPANPALITNQNMVDGLLIDSDDVLPSFGPDAQVVWAIADSMVFVQMPNVNTQQLGFITPAFLFRLKSAANSTREQAIHLADKLYPREEGDISEPAWNGHDAHGAPMWDIIFRLQRTLLHLEDIPTSVYDVILWTREVQRLILELQSWVIYHAVVKPRIDDPLFSCRGRVLPLRGVITSQAVVAKTMHRIGVPVWWVRPFTSLTDKTRVVRTREWIPYTIALSQEKQVHYDKYSLPAPEFTESPIVDDNMQGLADHIRRFSLSSRLSPGLVSSLLTRYVPSTLSEEHQGSRSAAASDAAGVLDLEEGPPKKKKKFKRRGKGGKSTDTNPVLPACPARPDWWPPIDTPWMAALQAHPDFPKAPTEHQTISYAFPPARLFASPCGEGLSVHMHNWLRIRPWCISEAFNSLNDRRVLLTGEQWRVAIKGGYFLRKGFDNRGTEVAGPQASPAEIAQLPPPPEREPKSTCAKRPRSEAEEGEVREGEIVEEGECKQTPYRTNKVAAKRSADRIDIAVRFGVHGRFPPHDPSQVVSWRSQPTSFADISSNPSICATVVWELSVLNFRMDLLIADRRMLTQVYKSGDNALIIRREEALKRVWDKDGSLRPRWENGEPADAFGGAPAERARAFARLAQVLADWPAAEQHLPSAELTRRVLDGLEDEIVTRSFMGNVCIAYSRMFHDNFDRLPSFPLERPAHI